MILTSNSSGSINERCKDLRQQPVVKLLAFEPCQINEQTPLDSFFFVRYFRRFLFVCRYFQPLHVFSNADLVIEWRECISIAGVIHRSSDQRWSLWKWFVYDHRSTDPSIHEPRQSTSSLLDTHSMVLWWWKSSCVPCFIVNKWRFAFALKKRFHPFIRIDRVFFFVL